MSTCGEEAPVRVGVGSCGGIHMCIEWCVYGCVGVCNE